MCKKVLIVLFIYSKVKQSFLTTSVNLVQLFTLISVILLSKMKSLFFSLWKFAKFLMSFFLPNSSCQIPWKHLSVFLQLLHQSSVPRNITWMYFFSWNIIYFGQNSSVNFKPINFLLWIKWSHQIQFWDFRVLM